MITYSPAPSRLCACALSGAVLVVSMVLMSSSAVLPYSFIWVLVSAGLCLLCFEIYFRYCLTLYIYTLDGGILYVTRRMGKKEVVVFDLDLSLACELVKKSRAHTRASLGSLAGYTSCVQNLTPGSVYYLIYRTAGVRAAALEISDEFAREINKHLGEQPPP